MVVYFVWMYGNIMAVCDSTANAEKIKTELLDQEDCDVDQIEIQEVNLNQVLES